MVIAGQYCKGLSIREYIAVQLMAGLYANSDEATARMSVEKTTQLAIESADALIAELSKTPST